MKFENKNKNKEVEKVENILLDYKLITKEQKEQKKLERKQKK
ncbi:MAG: hypothetical protein ACOC1P_00625 [Minisyncoccales bacterium]